MDGRPVNFIFNVKIGDSGQHKCFDLFVESEDKWNGDEGTGCLLQ